MNLVSKFVGVMLLLSLSQAVHAGAVEDVIEHVKASCGGKAIDAAAALKLVKPMLKSCSDGDMIEVDASCKAPCKKSAGGDVVGGK